MSDDTIELGGAVEKMLLECDGDSMLLGERIAGVLEFLTLRAVHDAPFIILTDNEEAMALFAAGDITQEIRDALADIEIKSWDDEMDAPDYLSDQDPGDEQDESASESE